ncbi:CoA transferase [Sinosporangium siamense]|uniref:CoA transferase n=1 Tax=Sinosporangium siamense TaxID=1367973 RepID=A0A919RR94_9ACTN|nr:CoA transferase [Sinosporangium siamense]GII97274.1 CoA transferase [Sinosporangium siamense]
MSSPLHGIRVLDFGQYVAGPAVALLLADLGAEVIRIDPPGGPRWASPAAAALNAGKKSIVLDLTEPADVTTARRLVAGADVVVENFRPGVMAGFGLGPEDTLALNPRVIHLSLPGFAAADPRRELPAWEGIVLAATGGFTDMGLNRILMGADPSYTPLPLASAYAAALGALAVGAGLAARRRTGRGDAFEVPLAEAVLEGLAFNSLAVSDLPPRYLSLREHEIARRRAAGEPMDLTYERLQELLDPFYRSYPCQDGRLFYHCCPAHRTHAIRSLQLLGIWDTVLAEGIPMADSYLSSDSWPDGADCTLLAYPLSAHWAARLSELIAAAFLRHPAEEWERRFDAAGIPGAAHRSTLEWMRSEHPRAAGLVTTVDDPVHGELTVPGPVVWTEGTPPGRRPAPALDADRAAILAGLPPGPPTGPPPGPSAEPGGLPLAGIRILDVTNVIAGPVIGATLARFGAEVVKIDPPTPGFDPYHTVVIGMHSQRGKRSVLADLRTPAGREVLDRLLPTVDVVTFNGSERQLGDLGLDPRRLREIRPEIVLVRVDAYGGPGHGPRSHAAGYDDNVQACTGIMTRFGGGPGTPEEHAHLGTIDALAGFCGAFAVVAALAGRGEHAPVMRTSLAAAGQLLQIPFLFDGAGRDDVPEPGGPDVLGEHAGYRCYPAADGWFFLAGPADAVAAALGLDAAAPQDLLVTRFREQPVEAWAELLGPHGVAVHRIERIAELRSRRLVRQSTGPVPLRDSAVFVRHDRHPSGREVDLIAPQAVRPRHAAVRMPSDAPRYGAHTREVLAELGFTPAEIEAMAADGAVADGWTTDHTYLPT